MIRIYHESNNGDRVVQTDAMSLEQFEQEAILAVLKIVEVDQGDLEFSLNHVIPRLLRLAFKVAGYKRDDVLEQRLLTIGYEVPTVPIVDVGARRMPPAAEV
jgi:hypothetical protein